MDLKINFYSESERRAESNISKKQGLDISFQSKTLNNHILIVDEKSCNLFDSSRCIHFAVWVVLLKQHSVTNYQGVAKLYFLSC